MTIGIYRPLFNNTSKCYIGQSINIEVRFTQHLNLLKLGRASIKLQNAYLEYGLPRLEILIECNQEELNIAEKETIEIFNSVNDGFNTCISAGGISQICGELHGNSNYTNNQILEVLNLLVSEQLHTFTEISLLTGVSKSVISGISCLSQHKWLRDITPDAYEKLVRLYHSGERKENTKTGIKVSEYTLISPEGLVYSVTNTRKFSDEHELDYSHVSKLLHGTRKTHRGWKLLST